MANPTLLDCIGSGRPLQSIFIQPLPPLGTPGTLASSGTISHNGKNYVRVNTSGAVTSVVLQKGVKDGQQLYIENTSANSITFAAAATSFVRDGVSAIIPGNCLKIFMWNGVSTRWTMESDNSAGGTVIPSGNLTLSAGVVTVTGATAASATGATGTDASDDTVTGGVGGATTIATTGAGGIGGDLVLTGGAGGVASAAVTSATGGKGGAASLIGGAGAAEAVSGAGIGIGGAGGAAALTGGVGGAVTVSTGNKTGGAGGASTVTGGVGGAASAGAGTDTGGVGGAAGLVAGAGGNGGDTGGVGGAVVLTAGNAGTGGNVNGGNIVLTFGTKTGSGTDGELEFANQIGFVAQSATAPTLPTFPAGWGNGTPKWLRALDTVAGKQLLIPVFVSS